MIDLMNVNKAEWRSITKDAKLYLITQFLLAGYFTWPFWYGFASERITPSQFGIYIAVHYIVGMLAEIPTGAFADSFGRKRSAMLGAMLTAVMPLIIFFGDSFEAYITGAVVSGIGSAFVSGSLESLLYEGKNMTSSIYRRVMQYDVIFWQVGLIIATAGGGLLYRINSFLPFGVQTLSFMLAVIIISRIHEAKTAQTAKQLPSFGDRIGQYLITNKKGFMHLFEVRQLYFLIIFGVAVGAIVSLGIEYMNEAAMIYYGFEPNARGLLLAGTKVIVLVILNTLVFRLITGDSAKLKYLILLTGLAYISFALDNETAFLIGFLFINLISAVYTNYIKPILHDNLQNTWRATAISSYSFLSNLVFALASLLTGIGLQQKGVIYVQRVMLLIFLLLAVPALIIFLTKLRDTSWQQKPKSKLTIENAEQELPI
jgi:MFS family permease